MKSTAHLPTCYRNVYQCLCTPLQYKDKQASISYKVLQGGKI